MKSLLWLLPVLLTLNPLRLAAQKTPATDTLLTCILQPADMQADFRYFRRLLEETHPGLYRYVPRASMQAKLDSIDRALTQPMPFYTFFGVVAALIGDIRCAHTHALPSKNWREQFNGTLKTIPIFMFPARHRSYVLLNGTSDQTIQPGFELLAINGESIEAIRERLYRYYWTDGYIESARMATLNGELFALFYYWFIDRPSTYALTFRNPTGDTVRLSTPAQPFTTTLKMLKKNPVNKQMVAWYVGKKNNHPWRLSFPDDISQTAILRLDAFGGKGMNNGDQAIKRFQQFMDKSMSTIAKKQAKNLIVDLRSNPGGWDSQGIELFTYLMKTDSAVPYYARQHSLTDSTEFLQFSDLSETDRRNVKQELIRENDGTFTLKQGSNTREPMRYGPKPNRFKGRVYILMDGKSASTASEFLAIAHANKVGVFIGEESGGAYEGGNGSSFITLGLPKSGIQVTTPLVYYDNAVGRPLQKGRGTLPDHDLPVTINDLLTHTDSQLEFVKELIKREAKGKTAGVSD